MTILPQKVINSMTQFMKIITRILIDYISKWAMPFLNDIEIKKSKDIAVNHEQIAFEIRRKILKHIH